MKTPRNDRIHVLVSLELLQRLDAWRRDEPGLPNRSVAMRLMMERGLDLSEQARAA